jgi:phosphoribosylamine-glycine ligase
MNILVLAGGSDQIALITELKKRGHFIILIDYFQNPVAKNYSDKHIMASTLDVDNVRKIAIQEDAGLITTACTDQALLVVARVSEELNLPCYISYQTALNVTNKSYMKKILSENNIPTANYVVIDTFLPENIDGFNYPLVVKPVDCNSSKGVKKVYKKDEIKNFVDFAISMSREKKAIIEEYKEGEEISADFYIQNGIANLLLVTGSYKIPNNNSFTILQSYFPTVNENEKIKITEIAQKISDEFNLKNTPLLLQLVKNNDTFFVIEFSARIGGGSKYKLIEVLSDVNIMNVYVDLILGMIPSVSPKNKKEFALMNYVYCNPGILYELVNFETLKKEEIIEEYFFYKTIGTKIEYAETSSDRAAGFLITGNNKPDIVSNLNIADQKLKVLDQAGNDIMMHGLYGHQK